MHRFKIAMALIALFASAAVFAKISGTYVLEFEGMGGGGGQGGGEVTLTLAVDDDGNYSATMASPMGEMEGESVDVEGNEFSFTTSRSTPQGDFTMSYSGTVEDGDLSGTMTHDWGETSFTGTLKEEESEDEGEMEASGETEA